MLGSWDFSLRIDTGPFLSSCSLVGVAVLRSGNKDYVLGPREVPTVSPDGLLSPPEVEGVDALESPTEE